MTCLDCQNGGYSHSVSYAVAVPREFEGESTVEVILLSGMEGELLYLQILSLLSSFI